MTALNPTVTRNAARASRSSPVLPPETSLLRAAEVMASHGLPAVFVGVQGAMLGALEESSIAEALATGSSGNDPIGPFLLPDVPTILANATEAEALRRIAAEPRGWIAVITAEGGPVGILTPAGLLAETRQPRTPPMIGGMATPAGVYLTNGRIGAGVDGWALIATGMTLFGLFMAATIILLAVDNLLVPDLAKSQSWYPAVYQGASLVLFLVGLRLSPIAGIHAAEHMTVHAIERGEPLELDVVSRMPRLHPRCGTNLAVGAMVFLGIMSSEWIPDLQLRLLAAIVAALALWRPVGMVLQHVVTTKPPTDDQIRMGIRSGRELLKRLEGQGSSLRPRPLQRILSSGILQIMAGAILLQLLAWGVMVLLDVPPSWRVF